MADAINQPKFSREEAAAAERSEREAELAVVSHSTLPSRFTSCPDGTICENHSPCLPHPSKESRYMCDCTQASGSFESEEFAGVYCEYKATAYCKRQSFFCANGGECRDYHDGCKCPNNYEGHYCQFVKGARPSDWSSLDYMHPALVDAYHNGRYGGSGSGGSMSVVGIVATVCACIVLVGALIAAVASGKLKLPTRSRKEMDTAAGPGGSSEFVAGASVYKKKTSAGGGGFVTEDTLDADGGVLQAALEGGSSLSDGAIMEEVDLNDDEDDLTAPTSGGGSPSKGEII